jgi:hypothetical protein
MPDPKELLEQAIESFLTGTVLRELGGKQIAGVDARCLSGFIKGLCKIEGEITFLGRTFEPDFLKTKTYLGDGVFDLRVDYPGPDSACKSPTVVQGIVDKVEQQFDVPVSSLGKATIKIEVGPVSFHFRIYKCEPGALRPTTAGGQSQGDGKPH